MNKNNLPIGFFDSGIGGLCILKTLLKKMPSERFFYLADTQNFPFGSKTKEAVITISKSNIDLLYRQGVKAIIIACNTASSHSLDILKKTYPTLYIEGVIDPVIAYIKRSAFKKIAILGTPATIHINYYAQKIMQVCNDIEVFSYSCPNMASMIENNLIKGAIDENLIRFYVQQATEKKVQAIVLGCTHYLYIKDSIRSILPPDVEIIDSDEIVSDQIEKNLNQSPVNGNTHPLTSYYCLTEGRKYFSQLLAKVIENHGDIVAVNFQKTLS